VGSIPGQTHFSCDSPPGFPVSSYIHHKSPNIVYRANNVLVDAQLSTQYFFYLTPTFKGFFSKGTGLVGPVCEPGMNHLGNEAVIRLVELM
jgi:hypothetical protein